MKISELILTNIKCFNKLKFSFINKNTNKPNDIVVIVGENGTGKTTLLKSIASCISMNNSVYGGEIIQDNEISNGKNYGHIEIRPCFNSKEKDFIKYYNPNEEKESFNQWIVSKRCSVDGYKVRKNNSIYLFDDSTGGTINFRNNGIEETFRKEDFPGGYISYFDVFRVLPKIKIKGPNYEELPQTPKSNSLSPSFYSNNSNLNDRFKYVKQWIVNIDYKEAKAFKDKGKEIGILKHIKNCLDVMFKPFEFSRVTEKSQILFNTPLGEVEIDELSDGLKSVFVIIGELLFRFSMACNDDPNKILNMEAVVLIDEIDCHLHPKWQLNIIPALREMFPNVQFIVTTHSPLIAQSVRPGEIYKIGRNEK